MKIKKVGKLLKKLNNLYENMRDDGDISQIERDLLLNYIRDLYEEVLSMPEDDEETAEPVKTATNPEYTPPAPARPEPVTEQTSDPAPPIVKQEASPAPPEPKPEPTPAPSQQLSKLNAEMSALFEIDSIREVSDRLSMTAISDMHRCMGINERIFTIRELFDGKDGLFSETMTRLNGLKSFDEAADFLQQGVAQDLDWTSDAKSKKASNFIKLVYRRYL